MDRKITSPTTWRSGVSMLSALNSEASRQSWLRVRHRRDAARLLLLLLEVRRNNGHLAADLR
jgi:hypothetical protein